MFWFLLNMWFSKYSALRKYSVCLVFCLSLLLLEYATPVPRCSCWTRLLSRVQLSPIQSNSVPALMSNGGLHRGVRYINFWKKKGTGDFERCRQTMDKLSLFGTSHCLFLLFLNPKIPIFWPTWTWNDTWMGHKSALHSHCMGCVFCPLSCFHVEFYL